MSLQLEQEAMRKRWLQRSHPKEYEEQLVRRRMVESRLRARRQARRPLHIIGDLSLAEAIARNQEPDLQASARMKSTEFRAPTKFRSPGEDLQLVTGLNRREECAFEQFHKPGTRVIRRGWPDLCFVENGKATCVEVKALRDALNPAQIETLSVLESLGFEVRVLIVDFADAGGAR